MNKSKISWTDFGWPVVTGCTKESPGCANCYAERMHKRFGHGKFSEVTIHPKKLYEPSGKALSFEQKNGRRPRVFVCPTSDLFHPEVPFDFINEVFFMMMEADHIDFQVLTKRADRMLEWSRENVLIGQIPFHIWMGVTAENQEQYDRRVPVLLNVPARLRWVSIEPMIGPIILGNNHRTIDWIVAGGESGSGARPVKASWLRSLRNSCFGLEIPFYFKQWGEWLPESQFTTPIRDVIYFGDVHLTMNHVLRENGDPDSLIRVGIKQSGHLLDECEYLEFPSLIPF